MHCRISIRATPGYCWAGGVTGSPQHHLLASASDGQRSLLCKFRSDRNGNNERYGYDSPWFGCHGALPAGRADEEASQLGIRNRGQIPYAEVKPPACLHTSPSCVANMPKSHGHPHPSPYLVQRLNKTSQPKRQSLTWWLRVSISVTLVARSRDSVSRPGCDGSHDTGTTRAATMQYYSHARQRTQSWALTP